MQNEHPNENAERHEGQSAPYISEMNRHARKSVRDDVTFLFCAAVVMAVVVAGVLWLVR